jgi:hypothetical protein
MVMISTAMTKYSTRLLHAKWTQIRTKRITDGELLKRKSAQLNDGSYHSSSEASISIVLSSLQISRQTIRSYAAATRTSLQHRSPTLIDVRQIMLCTRMDDLAVAASDDEPIYQPCDSTSSRDRAAFALLEDFLGVRIA